VQVSQTSLPGVLLIKPRVFPDRRGFFLETFSRKKYADAGLDHTFLQDNHSRSCRETLRGLHYQLNLPQAKLVYAVTGRIFDVAVDLRRGSPTFGKWVGVNLSEHDSQQMFIPEGFAHGFCVLSETADVIYKCTNPYAAGDDCGILWSDQTIRIDWPIDTPILSDRDSRNPKLCDIPPEHLPVYDASSQNNNR